MKAYVVDTQKVTQNIAVVKTRAGEAAIYGVVKGDGYGLGLLELARLLRAEGITRFAVTEPADAARLRAAGFMDEEILMLRSTADKDEILAMLDNNVTATVGSTEAAMALNGIADQRRTVIEAHVKIDTGMGRYGFLPEEMDKITSLYRYMPGIAITGIYTHLHSAFKSEKAVLSQLERFEGVLARLRGENLELGVVHALNSSALLRYDVPRYDAVRIGSAFTGRVPGKLTFGLLKVGYIESAVSEVRWLRRGCTVGYGAAWRARRPTRIAVVPVGYCDGFCMEKSKDTYRFGDFLLYLGSLIKKWLSGGRMYVKIGSSRARVLGHVGMLSTVVDVTDLACSVGDPVTLEASPLYVAALPKKYL